MATKKPKFGVPAVAGFSFVGEVQPYSGSDLFVPEATPVPEPAPPPTSAVRRVAQDGGIALLKGAIAVPEAAVGLADLATGGRVGQFLENEGGAIGFRPKMAKQALDEMKTPEQQAADRALQEAEGFVETTKAALANPSVIFSAAGESIPSMLGGGVVARSLLRMAPARVAATTGARIGAGAATTGARIGAGAAGEGVVAAGSQAEGIRQETADGLLTGTQSLLAAGSGAATGVLGLFAGNIARRLGITDVDTLLAGKATPEATKGFLRRVLEGAAAEGLLEELPQSVQEQMAQNLALNRPIGEGIERAAVLGALTGGMMGGASNIASPGAAVRAQKQPDEGPATRALNDGLEFAAQQAEAATAAPPVQAAAAPVEPMAVVPPEEPAMPAAAAAPADVAPVAVDLPVKQAELDVSRGADPPAEPSPVPAAPPPLAPPGPAGAAFAQREADRPEEPTGQPLPTDITGPEGKPFVTMRAAMRVAQQAGAGAEIVRVAGGLVVRRVDAETGEIAATTPELPGVEAAPPAPADPDPLPDDEMNPLGQPFTHKGAAANRMRALGKDTHTIAKVKGGFVVRKLAAVVAPIDAAAHAAATSPNNDLTDPTDGQKEAMNYKMGHHKLAGLHLSIENPAGSVRRGKDKTGKAWENTLKHHYGRIKGTVGGDGEHVDAFVKPGTPDDWDGTVFVVDQIHPDTGAFDEHKSMFGFDTEAEAREAYAANYAKGWKGLKAVTAMPAAEFKAWVTDGPKNAPLAQTEGATDETTAAEQPGGDARPDASDGAGRAGVEGGAVAAPAADPPAAESGPADLPALKRQWQAAVQAGDSAGATRINDAIVAAKAAAKAAAEAPAAGSAPAAPAEAAPAPAAPEPAVARRKRLISEREDGSAVLKRLGFADTGPGPGEWVIRVSGLGEVIAKVVSKPGEPVRAEISADYMGKRLDSRTAEGEPAIKAAIERARDGINKGRERMANEVRAKESGVAEPAAPAALPAPKPKRSTAAQRAADARAAALAEYFSPGNVLKGYGGFDRVVEFQPAVEGKPWSVQVQRVVKQGDDYVPEKNERPRWHATEPEAKDLKAGPVLRAPASSQPKPEAAPAAQAGASQPNPPAPGGGQQAPEPSGSDTPAAAVPEAEPAPAAAPVKTKEGPAKIEDFGEKLEGARKDYATTLKDAEAVDIAAEPLSKSWPEPDYDKLLAGGADPYMVAFIHAARDEVPTKPQKGWKLKGWVQSVEMLRGMAQKLLSGSITAARVREMLDQREFHSLRGHVGSRAELYELVGHKHSLKGVTFAEHHYSLYRGQENVRKWVAEQKAKATAFSNWPRELAVADTKAEMLEQFKAKLDGLDLSKKAKATTSFDIYRKRGETGAFIGKKIGREYIDLKKVDDVTAARKYLEANTAELEAALDRYKETPFERNPENLPRVGDDHRNGAPVTPEVFAETFGFRGVQFGNYVEQGRRQSDLNEAFDALMDMAAVLGIPPRAISLNGRLGLAFGARGKGGKSAPAAHYEPGNVVINLTKGSGPGSLGHEWWHSVDNYFGKEFGTGGFVTDGVKVDRLRAEMQEAFKAVRSATQAPLLRRRAAELDKRRSKPYWNTPLELSARSFESYLIAKLKDQGAANDYLANVVDEKVWNLSEEARATFFGGEAVPTYPYPGQAELPAVRTAFDEFFRTVQTREDEAGNVAMFKRGDGGGLDLASAQALAEQLAGQGLLRINVARSVDDLPPQPKRWLKAQAPDGRVRGAYLRGTDQVWLFTDHLRGADEFVRVTLHEAFHRGLANTIPETKALLRQMHRTNTKLQAATADQMRQHKIGRDEAIEEALAVMAEDGTARDLSGWDQLLATVRSWLQKMASAIGMPSMTWTDDMIEDFVAGMRREGLKGGVHVDRDIAPVAMSRAEQPESEGFDVKGKTANTLAHYRGMSLQLLGRRQLVDLYAKDIPSLASYGELVQRMDAEKNETAAEADTLASDWAKLPDERQLAELMHEATLAQIDPDKDHEPGDNIGEWRRLRAAFNGLSDKAQATFRKARDTYSAHHTAVREAIRGRIERSELGSTKKKELLERMDADFFKKVKGVYFPLARFGQYVTVVRNRAGDAVSVNRAETLNEAEAMRKELLKQFPAAGGFQVGKVLKDREFNAARDGVGRGFMADLFQTLEAQGAGEELQDAISQLYLSALPDLSWAKHGIHRKGTPGFSQDARRAFAQNVFHGARYLAKLRYADQLHFDLDRMQKEVDEKRNDDAFDSVKGQQVVDEMVKRHELLMNPKTNPVSTALTSLGFIFHLGLSPASAMVNLSQTALVAYPIMGARWGFTKSAAALATASREAAGNRNDISKALKGQELDAYEEAVRTGVIDVTMAHDLAGIAQGEDAKVAWRLRPVMKWASFLFHHAERFNRQVTFIAAYRLARETGAAHAAAYEQAVAATYDGHFDYGASNRPRLMQGNVAKVVLLFKQYAQNMIYTLTRQAYLGFMDKSVSPAERAEARKALGGLLTMHAAAAGALGLPVVGSLLAAASWLGSDDDEPWDAEVALQNTLADAFGNKAAEVMTRGVSRLTPWDISGRVGLDKLLLPDIQEGLEGRRAAEAWYTALGGPVVGIGVGMVQGLSDIAQGQFGRGLESMMPAAVRGPLKAYRFGDEGAIDKSGVEIVADVGVAGVAGQALGFSPSKVRQATEGKSAIFQHDRRLQDRRSRLVGQFARAFMAGDQEAVAELREDIRAFNEKNRERSIKPENLRASVAARRRRIEEAEQGVYLPKKRSDAMEAGRFATAEAA